MRKIFTLLSAVLLSLQAMATTFTFTSEADANQTKDGFTVVLSKGSGNNAPYLDGNSAMRLYADNTITITGADIKNVQLTFTKQGSKAYADLSASTGSLQSGGQSTSNTDYKVDTWTGSTSKLTFTLGSSGQRIIAKIVVNGDGSESDIPTNPDDPSKPDNPSTLDPSYQYQEPTVVAVPDFTVQGEAYSFVVNNVKVDCTKGAITADYFSAHAGFEMTFTATKPIKGLVIDGFVKKEFEAESSAGDISYLTPSSDIEANPVLVIKNADATSITISCVKQLRCYSVELYFDANPEATIEGGTIGGGDGEELVFDSAEAIYESEFVELFGEENYTIFLFNAASPDVPYFALDIYPENKDELAGTYTTADYSLGDFCYYVWGMSDDDFTWCDSGSVTISRNGDIYTITGSLFCYNMKTYKISFTGSIPIYTDDEYYDDGGGSSRVDDVIEAPADDENAPMYDMMGRRVGKDYRGIYIRNGKKGIAR